MTNEQIAIMINLLLDLGETEANEANYIDLATSISLQHIPISELQRQCESVFDYYGLNSVIAAVNQL